MRDRDRVNCEDSSFFYGDGMRHTKFIDSETDWVLVCVRISFWRERERGRERERDREREREKEREK